MFQINSGYWWIKSAIFHTPYTLPTHFSHTHIHSSCTHLAHISHTPHRCSVARVSRWLVSWRHTSTLTLCPVITSWCREQVLQFTLDPRLKRGHSLIYTKFEMERCVVCVCVCVCGVGGVWCGWVVCTECILCVIFSICTYICSIFMCYCYSHTHYLPHPLLGDPLYRWLLYTCTTHTWSHSRVSRVSTYWQGHQHTSTGTV